MFTVLSMFTVHCSAKAFENQENPPCHKFSLGNSEKFSREAISQFLGNIGSRNFTRTFCCMHVISFISNQIYYLVRDHCGIKIVHAIFIIISRIILFYKKG